MKSTARFSAVALVLTCVAAPADGLSLIGGVCRTLSGALEASTRVHKTPLFSASFAISKFSARGVVGSFEHAWRRTGNGLLPSEGVVLILRMADGSYRARELGATNEFKKFTFAWHPATIAVVHTHPNSSDPRPQDDDIALADKHRIPVFTITSRGMYVYDPATKRISRVKDDLDWLDQKKWISQT